MFKRDFKTFFLQIKNDKKNIFYLIYYSIIESLLLLIIPLAASFIINSILSHSRISITTLSFIVVVIFLLTILLQMVKIYIIEKLEQSIFIRMAILISKKILLLGKTSELFKQKLDKSMNYFFDVLTIEKTIPLLLLDGTGLIVKLFISLSLLFVFNSVLFLSALFILIIFSLVLYLLGTNGVKYTIKKSDAKHEVIYYLQNIPYKEEEEEKSVLEKFDYHLTNFIKARLDIFRVIFRQLTLTYFLEGLIVSIFLILGANLVMNGDLTIGEFIAVEMIVVSITYALKSFMKHIDYIYDMIEGLHKIETLKSILSKKEEVK